MEQPSGYGKLYHTTFHDPCKVRAAVFDDGATRAALVGVDAASVPRSLALAVRREVEPGEYDGTGELVRRLAYEQSTVDNPEYVELVRRQTVEVICEADRTRAAARSGAGLGREEKVAFNRRFRMRNGQSWTHPGQGNPDIIGPAGPVDPAVGVIGAEAVKVLLTIRPRARSSSPARWNWPTAAWGMSPPRKRSARAAAGGIGSQPWSYGNVPPELE